MSRWVPLLIALLGVPSLADDPPRPDPENPVDYVKWCNEHYANDAKGNAAELYDRALKGGVDCGEADPFVFIDKKPEEWTSADRDALNDWFTRNERRVALFERATRQPHCFLELRFNWFPEGVPKPTWSERGTRSLAAHTVPDQFPMRDMVTHFVARARLRFHEGDSVEGAEDVCTALRAAYHLFDQPLQLHCMSGFSLAQRAYGALLDAPVQFAERLDYAAVLEVLRQKDPLPPKPLKQLDFELVYAWDLLQRFLRDSDGDGLYDRYTAYGPARTIALADPVRFETAVRGAETLHGRWRTVYSLDDYRRARRIAERLQPFDWDAYHRKLFADEDQPHADEQRKRLIERSGPQAAQFDFQWKLLQYWRHLQMQRRGARIVLCMHAFRAEHRRWPRDLREATQGEPANVRRDPFSPTDFVYRVERGEPLVYSVSEDGDDDNGRRTVRHEPDGDWVFWPPAEE